MSISYSYGRVCYGYAEGSDGIHYTIDGMPLGHSFLNPRRQERQKTG